jgi:hypothetical protein
MQASVDIVRAAQWLEDADGLLLTSGAGMGVDSGLPDFRGIEAVSRVRGSRNATGPSTGCNVPTSVRNRLGWQTT